MRPDRERQFLQQTQAYSLQPQASLSIRSGRQNLPVVGSEANAKDWRVLLAADGNGDAWRIIEAISERGNPFDLEVRWTAATAGGAWVKATLAHAGRICVFARSLQLRALNLSSSTNQVKVTVADGFAPTANGWEHRGRCDAESDVTIAIPPFATFYHLHLAERAALTGAELVVWDGLDVARARFSAANQPPGGIPVGGAGKLTLTSNEATDFRGVFQLAL